MHHDDSPLGMKMDFSVTSDPTLEQELSNPQLNFFTYIVDTVADPIFVKNDKHQWIVLNEAFCKFMGKSHDELIGKSDYDFFPEAEADVFWSKDNEVFLSGNDNVNEETFTSADGKQHVISTKKSLFTHPKTGKKYLVGVLRDITEIKESEYQRNQLMMELKKLAITDELTGLANRRHLYEIAEHEILSAKRNKQGILLIYADIDNLKLVNDVFGHAEGDNCIVETATILKNTLRESDVIARMGGDEFVVLISGQSTSDGINAIERLELAINNRNSVKDNVTELSVSMGFSYLKWDENTSIDELISRADSSMYVKKKMMVG